MLFRNKRYKNFNSALIDSSIAPATHFYYDMDGVAMYFREQGGRSQVPINHSFGLWVKLSANGEIMNRWYNGHSYVSYSLSMVSGYFQFKITDGTNTDVYRTTATYSLNTWYFLVITTALNTGVPDFKMYVNASSVGFSLYSGSGNVVSYKNNTTLLNIASLYEHSNASRSYTPCLVGPSFEISSTLSAAQITTMYNSRNVLNWSTLHTFYNCFTGKNLNGYELENSGTANDDFIIVPIDYSVKIGISTFP